MDYETLKQLGYGALVIILLGYIGKLIIPYLFKKIDEKDRKISELVDKFHQTTEKFTEVTNHKATEHTQAIIKLGENMDKNTNLIIKALKKK